MRSSSLSPDVSEAVCAQALAEAVAMSALSEGPSGEEALEEARKVNTRERPVRLFARARARGRR